MVLAKKYIDLNRVGSDRLNKLDSICQEPLCANI